jgi:formylglycine-generating enzyme required for sulfatase activity
MPKLFISYRRNDSADATGRLHDRLKAHFGEESLFYDVDSIPIGLDFRKYIGDAVGQCDVLLAVIGDDWVTASNDGQRRLENPNDLVRVEIETALARGIPVVPVLVGKARMPDKSDLPGDLERLADRNAAEVRSGADFDGHAVRLIQKLEKLFAGKSDLDGRLRQANQLADHDPEIALTPSRTALEIVIREMYERRLGEPPGNRSLEQLGQRLDERGVFPGRLDVMSVVDRLEKLRNRPVTKRVTSAESSQLLTDLTAVLKWYMTVEQPDSVGQSPSQPRSGQPANAMPASDIQAKRIAIVPKGLRSFDARDADFFLDLLPGPRDKNGLPDSIRFWKHRIEERDEVPFTVGVIYGPSGCGKSSLVKAGLLPRLAGHVVSVYVESTGAETETRLLNGLRKRCPELPQNLDLTGTILALRQGHGLRPGQKVFIVLDQFEQWLHAKNDERDTELVRALRQCDGGRVQAVVMVRDDFWMGVDRFLKELDLRLRDGENSASADLFDIDHARKVLAAFGWAFGKLPDNSEETTPDQNEFLKQAVAGLAQEGKVISVRLALFADMMQGKPWNPSSLKSVGGTEGVGATFLEETFSAAGAPPEHRVHQVAARQVLKALLPESGTDIKGTMRSHGELLDASGYNSRPKADFDDLIRILDSEVRLITPTDPEGKEGANEAATKPLPGQRYYQLTHDYLVPSLPDWLTRKQKETRRGRAELLLADRAIVWNSRTENRQLPSLWQWMQIQWLTRRQNWSAPQRKMMSMAGKYHALRGTAVALLLLVATVTGLTLRAQALENQKATHAAGLVRTVLTADIGEVQANVDKMAEYRKWTDEPLRQALDNAAENSPEKLRASLALLPVDDTQVDHLYRRLLDATPKEVPVLCRALDKHSAGLLERLWTVVETPDRGRESQRLRAAAALAMYDPQSDRWTTNGALVVRDLVRENSVFLGDWSNALRPVKNRLIPELSDIFRDQQPERAAERSLATNLLADYAADQPEDLARLVMDADDKQFAALFPKLKEREEQGLPVLIAEIDRTLPADAEDAEKETLAKRQANAAVALLRLDQPQKVWPLLGFTPDPAIANSQDPRRRSYLIHRQATLGANPQTIVKQLDDEKVEISIRRALLLSLGEFDEAAFPPENREAVLPKVKKLYETSTDAGLHAAAEWLLRTWHHDEWLKQVNDDWKQDKEQREQRLATIQQQLVSRAALARGPSPQWYVNGEGQTLVVIPGPIEFLMGSPPNEKDRFSTETQHKKRIGRTFAISAQQVTWEQYLKFAPQDKDEREENFSPTLDCPVNNVSWHSVAKYCNWLTEREGIDPGQCCYTIAGKDETTLKKNYLSKLGYRLPTETEMEYATRSGAVTARFFGETDWLLAKYARYQDNSDNHSWPVGRLKPNEFGLFDVQGNLWMWCQDPNAGYPVAWFGRAVADQPDAKQEAVTTSRVLRGGSFASKSSSVRSASRNSYVPTDRGDDIGFRLARTFPLVPLTALPSSPQGAKLKI